ncbi:hypothetical protein [Cytobacillus gottheilii]|uniref:Uncharacterized protein n=1 Tax=Cytobacillus gottheilii TaxID=859144 RepID=A0ABX8FG44_9BACI|nr:hypothetical protein [Cytobacillus gottheilii]QVY62964.1 hypothetical protein J1899_07955 [Cytobacillus gottheilii]
MEILAVTTHWFIYLFGLTLIGGFALLLLLGIFVEIEDWVNSGVDKKSFPGLLIIVFLLTFTCFALTEVIKDGPPKTYDAKVTDFNEVYNNGYHVKGKRGDLYKLEKSEAK